MGHSRNAIYGFTAHSHLRLSNLGEDNELEVQRGRAAALPPSEIVADATDKTTHLRGSKKHVDARAQLVDGEFTLLEGSRIALNMDVVLNSWAETTKVQHATRQELRSKLFADGALSYEGAVAVATRDIVFSSPSAASATALVPHLLYALGPAK